MGRFGRELRTMTVGKLETLYSNNAQLPAALRLVAVQGQGWGFRDMTRGQGSAGSGSVRLLWL